jgi:hypothetical protein
MSETDSPDTGSGNDTALSLEGGAAAIENLLSNVPDQPETEGQDSGPSEESRNEGQPNADAADAADDTDGLEFDDETTEPVTDAPKEPEFKAGQFAARDAKVKLDDGSTISVADLISGNMFQRTFTEKTTALSQDKRALEAEKGQFAETKQQIEHQRNVILTLAQELLPQEPAPVDPDQDPLGYMQYLRDRDVYQEKMNKLSYLWQSQQQEQVQLTQRQQQEQEQALLQQQEQFQAGLKAEWDLLVTAIPHLKDEAKRQQFQADAVEIGSSVYGLKPEEINSVVDHRFIRVLADAVAFRKAIAKRDAAKLPAPPAQAQQPRIQQRQRMAPQTVQARDQSSSFDRLRKTGSLTDAAKALEKFV